MSMTLYASVTFSALVQLTLMSTLHGSQKSETSGQIKLVASVSKNNIKSGDPIWVTLVLINDSSTAVHLLVTSPEKDYVIDIRNEKNELLSLSERGKRIRGDDTPTRRLTLELAPKEHSESRIEVTESYDLSKPGNYQLVAVRTIHHGQKASVVMSNAVRFVLTK